MNDQNKRNRRRIKLIKPRLQLKLTGVFLGLSGLGFLLQSLHVGLRLSEVAGRLPSDGTFLMALLPELPIEILLFSFGMLMPLTLAVGVLVTFRIAGPVYRFEQYLKEVKSGRQLGPCKLRDGDELQELCALINEVTEPLRRERTFAEGTTDQEAEGAGATNRSDEEVPLRQAG